ncbi:MAG: hypothetical protein KAS94_11645 [Desulfobulbaceae bacterium]|nr:hypothetical protein [Desulfobulbaceae bacterium]
MSHTNTWETNGLYRKFTGVITAGEILESNFKIHVHPDFQKIKYIINDFTEISEHSLEKLHMKAYALTDDVISETKGHLKIAIVVNQDALIDLAKNYRQQMKDKMFECEIFQTVDDARSWGSNQ